MNIERFCLKFFAQPGHEIDDAVFIDIFHDWIRLKKLPGILLDVVDYRHLPGGPGVMLISHEINFAMDYAAGRLGLFAQRKLGQADSHPDRILEVVRATATFGALLEADPRLGGRLRLIGDAFDYIANDRLLLPNTDLAFAALRPDLIAAAERIYPGQAVSITRRANDPRDRLTASVAVEPGAGSVALATLAERVGIG